MVIKQATPEDAAEILALHTLASRGTALPFNPHIPHATPTLEELRRACMQQVVLKAVENNIIIGTISGCLQDETCYISDLVVHFDYRNQGIGCALMDALETRLASAHRFELTTALTNKRHLYFYQKCGYRLFKAEKITHDLVLIFLEKHRNQTTALLM